MKFQVEMDETHYALLEAMAKDDYRDVRQQASYLVACAVSGWAVWRADPEGPDAWHCERCAGSVVACACPPRGADTSDIPVTP